MKPIILIPGVGGTLLKLRRKDGFECIIWPKIMKGSNLIEKYLWSRYDDKTGELIPFHQNFVDEPDSFEIFVPEEDNGLYAIYSLLPNIANIPMIGNMKSIRKSTGYFNDMIDYLKEKGYESGKTLFGGGFDWRYGPKSPEVYDRLVGIIENANLISGERVNLISHSLGCLMVKYLFIRKGKEWMNNHINGWICLGAPWQGTTKASISPISGYNGGMPQVLLNPLVVRQLQCNTVNTLLLTPKPDVFEDSPKIFIKRPNGWSIFSAEGIDFYDPKRSVQTEEEHFEYRRSLLKKIDEHILPEDFALELGKKEDKEEVMIEKHVCDNCEREYAICFCNNCHAKLCIDCMTQIHSNKIFYNHTFLTLKQYLEQSQGIVYMISNFFNATPTPKKSYSFNEISDILENDPTELIPLKTSLPFSPKNDSILEYCVNFNTLFACLFSETNSTSYYNNISRHLFILHEELMEEKDNLEVPDNFHCANVFAADEETPWHAIYDKTCLNIEDVINETPALTMISGDRTVPLQSLKNHGFKFDCTDIELHNTSHFAMMHQQEVYKVIDGLVDSFEVQLHFDVDDKSILRNSENIAVVEQIDNFPSDSEAELENKPEKQKRRTSFFQRKKK
eukprot:TRINITY_DN1939_c0_g1_i1.p1 TRINITY_DN1939_c0_g1~~TRINITY_DN1939_c0_g1_i1.p1  ORF type:complete len:620 (+),score=166.54 TRINITY_DN1939_c0_g1_i1:175-2034(+)